LDTVVDLIEATAQYRNILYYLERDIP
jgi:hypothetical protein